MMPATARVLIVVRLVSELKDEVDVGSRIKGASLREYVKPASPNSATRSKTFDDAPNDRPAPGEVDVDSRETGSRDRGFAKITPGGRFPEVVIVSEMRSREYDTRTRGERYRRRWSLRCMVNRPATPIEPVLVVDSRCVSVWRTKTVPSARSLNEELSETISVDSSR